jgi:hypothetical protein
MRVASARGDSLETVLLGDQLILRHLACSS